MGLASWNEAVAIARDRAEWRRQVNGFDVDVDVAVVELLYM